MVRIQTFLLVDLTVAKRIYVVYCIVIRFKMKIILHFKINQSFAGASAAIYFRQVISTHVEKCML